MKRLHVCLTIVTLLALPLASQAALVGYWDFDDNVLDQSGNSNDGTILGDPSYDADTPAALTGSTKSLEFDGAGDQVSINHGAGGLNIQAEAAFTLSMWVKGNGTTQPKDKRVFAEGSTSDTDPIYSLGTHKDGTGGNLDFFHRPNDGNPSIHQLSNSTSPFDGSWRHIAWVDIGTTATLYVDGVADSMAFTHTTETLATNTTTIGGILRNAQCCEFTGNIDDVAVWDAAIDTAWIPLLAAGTHTPMTVPEPSTLALAAAGLAGLVRRRRRV